jgi:sec-independent protein translocase protein TatA
MSSFRPELAAFGVGGGELMIVLVIILVLFGGAKLPGLARGLGQSIKEFKKAQKDDEPEKVQAKVIEEKKTEAANTHGTN